MKKILLSLALIVGSITVNYAQIKEGHVTYKIDISTENPDMEMVVGMMQGSTLDIYFKEKMTRAEMKMGSMMNMTTISDEKSGKLLMLMSGMIGKKAISTTTEELSSKDEKEKPKYEVELVDETKDIAGYKCKKAILTDEEGNESTFWYTEEIEVSKKGQNYLNENVPGYPMQYEINNSGLVMGMTVTNITKELSKSDLKLFDMSIPEGYAEMTMEELQQMGMGM
jgi:GLPGLI family protein